MTRPVEYPEERTTTAVRIPPDLNEALKEAAAERGLSRNRLILLACEEFIQRLIPVEEFTWTRGNGSGHTLPPFDPAVERTDQVVAERAADLSPEQIAQMTGPAEPRRTTALTLDAQSIRAYADAAGWPRPKIGAEEVPGVDREIAPEVSSPPPPDPKPDPCANGKHPRGAVQRVSDSSPIRRCGACGEIVK